MNSNQSDTPSYFGEAVLAATGGQGNKFGFSPVEINTSYFNNLSVPVAIGLRSGLKFPCPSLDTMTCNKFTIRVEIIIRSRVKVDIQRILHAVNESSSQELQVMRESFQTQISRNVHGTGVTITLDYMLSLEQLQDLGGTVYFHETDAMVSLLPFNELPSHPHSEEGQKIQLINASAASKETTGFGYSIEIIDSTGCYGERYLNIGNKVYRVAPKHDKMRRDGVYIISNKPVKNRVAMSGIYSKHFSFDQADEVLGLYRTAEEALFLGDVTQARKRELATMEHDLSVQKAALQREKAKSERELLERQNTEHLLEIERSKNAHALQELREESQFKLDCERQRLKDYYEKLSYQRKNSNEVIKLLPSIIIGIGSFLLTLRKLLPIPVP